MTSDPSEVTFRPREKLYRSCMPFSRTYDAERRVLPEAERLGVTDVVMLVGDDESATKPSEPRLRD